MTKRYHNAICFSRSKGRLVEAEFTGAEVTSNGGAMLLAEADRRMGLTQAAADAIGDDRRRKSVVHTTRDVIRQWVYGLLLGHEDLNDHGRLRWCGKTGVGHVIGLPSNKRLAALPAPLASAGTAMHRLHGGKQRLFDDFMHAADSWPHERQVVVKAERTDLGANTRFIVTSLDMADDPQGLYDGMCCERGEMENRIKDQQLGLFADRASSSGFAANQFRLLISALAFVLLEGMRRRALGTTELAKASPQTVRLTLPRSARWSCPTAAGCACGKRSFPIQRPFWTNLRFVC